MGPLAGYFHGIGPEKPYNQKMYRNLRSCFADWLSPDEMATWLRLQILVVVQESIARTVVYTIKELHALTSMGHQGGGCMIVDNCQCFYST